MKIKDFKNITKISEADLQLKLVRISAKNNICATDVLKEKGFVEFADKKGRQRFSKDNQNFKYNHPIWDIETNQILLRKLTN